MNPLLDFKIRSANRADLTQITTLGRKTFHATYYDHFVKDFTIDSLTTYLDQKFSFEIIEKEFHENHSHFFIAEDNHGHCIGYMKVNHAAVVPDFVPGTNKLYLERIYLDSKFQGQGLGKKLINTCVGYASTHNIDTIWLGCWDGNISTLLFYEKMGFKTVGSDTFFITGSHFSDRDLILALSVQ